MTGQLPAAPRSTPDETARIFALRQGDSAAFATLVEQHAVAMLRVARGFVASQEVAEDVVQETWIAVLTGIDGFEGRSSLRTWLFTILVNTAKARGVRDRRDTDTAIRAYTGGTVDPARFRDSGDPYPGHWREPPAPFPETPEGNVLRRELLDVARTALDTLAERQKMVVTLRDVLGFDAVKVQEFLDISAANQRVLVHRGRAGVRQHLEDYLGSRR